MLGSIPARHILLLNDSCFSGDLLDGSRDVGNRAQTGYTEAADKYRSREVITSGMSEPVADMGFEGHSPFAYHVLDALSQTDKKWIDGSDIYDRVKRGVSGQVPLFGSLISAGHQKGGHAILYRTVQMSKVKKTESTAQTVSVISTQIDKCPICGMRNVIENTFECQGCRRDFMCKDHFVKEQRCCEECASDKQKKLEGDIKVHIDQKLIREYQGKL